MQSLGLAPTRLSFTHSWSIASAGAGRSRASRSGAAPIPQATTPRSGRSGEFRLPFGGAPTRARISGMASSLGTSGRPFKPRVRFGPDASSFGRRGMRLVVGDSFSYPPTVACVLWIGHCGIHCWRGLLSLEIPTCDLTCRCSCRSPLLYAPPAAAHYEMRSQLSVGRVRSHRRLSCVEGCCDWWV